MGKKLTLEEVQEKIAINNPNIKIIGDYSGTAKRAKCQCLIDGYIWTPKINHLLYYNGRCPKCNGTLPITQEDFVNKMKIIHPNITVLGQYEKSCKKVRVKCNIDGYEWDTTPNSLFSLKCGCPQCAGNARYTPESFREVMKEKNPDIEILDDYVNNKTHLKCRCLVDGYEWNVTPNNLLRGKGCPVCHHCKKLTNEEFVARLSSINQDIIPLEEYVNYDYKIKLKCNICGHEWNAKPDNLLVGKRCPKCKSSQGEKKIDKFLMSYGIKFKRQKWYKNCRDQLPLPFDFYIEELNTLIEYQRAQHYMPVNFGGISDIRASENLEKVRLHDEIKRNFCKEYNIDLLTISYLEFDIIEDVLEEYIDNRKAYIKQHPESLQGNAQAL